MCGRTIGSSDEDSVVEKLLCNIPEKFPNDNYAHFLSIFMFLLVLLPGYNVD